MFKFLTRPKVALLILFFYFFCGFKFDNDILSDSTIECSDIISIEIFRDSNQSHPPKKILITDSAQIEQLYNYIETLPKLRVPIPNLVGLGGSTFIDFVLLLDNNSSVNFYITNSWTTTLYYNQRYYKLLNDDIFSYLDRVICEASAT